MSYLSSIRTVHLVHHTHMDIGYTDLPSEVLDQHLRHMDRVLELCRDNAERPENEHFYWTCESALLVRDYLNSRPSSRREELLCALRAGWIELQAFLTQPLTELSSPEELIANLRYAVDLGRREGFPVMSGMIDDIGGYAGRLPTVLAGLGVPFLVAGIGAFQVHLPWAELPHLFYLEAADGCRTLVWNLGINRNEAPQEQEQLRAVYGLGALHLVMPFRKAFTGVAGRGVEADLSPAEIRGSARAQFRDLEDRLSMEGYDYEDVMLQYGGDNRGPDDGLTDLVRKINQEEGMPEIRLTTPLHFFRMMVAKHQDRIPVVRHVLTDPWNMRANPQPIALKAYRQAQRNFRAAEARRALAVSDRHDEGAATADSAMHKLQLFSDHTCGLSEWGWRKSFSPESGGCRAPVYDRYRESWRVNRLYAEGALQETVGMLRAADGRLQGGAGEKIVIMNDCPYPNSGPVELYLGRDHEGLADLRDVDSGSRVPFQMVDRNRYLLLSPEVPGFGMKELKAEFGPSAPAQPGCSEVLDNGVLALSVDPVSGQVLSLKSIGTGREWQALEDGLALGDVVYETISGVPDGPDQAGMCRDIERHRHRCGTVEVAVTHSGPVLYEVVVTQHIMPPDSGPIAVQKTYRMFAESARLDVSVRVDKPETAAKECLYVAFPFAAEDSELVFDQNVGVVDPGRDLGNGSMTDLFYGFTWALLRNGEGSIVVGLPDAPIIQAGRIRTLTWEQNFPFQLEKSCLYSQIYHNLLNTDCPIWQEVFGEFRYSLWFDDGNCLTTGQVNRIAERMTSGLRAGLGSMHSAEGVEPLSVATEPEAVRILSIVRGIDGIVRVRLENLSAVAVNATVRLCFPIREVWLEDLRGNGKGILPVIRQSEILLPLDPNQFASLAIMPDVRPK